MARLGLSNFISSSCNVCWNVFQNHKHTVRWFYFATAEVRFMFSLSFRKLGLTLSLEYLCQFFINFNNQCQFWNPHDEQITNLSLIFKFNEEITEKIGNEKDETKLIFEKYQLSLTSNISAKISSNWACRVGWIDRRQVSDMTMLMWFFWRFIVFIYINSLKSCERSVLVGWNGSFLFAVWMMT